MKILSSKFTVLSSKSEKPLSSLVRYLFVAIALFVALVPVYWAVTISLKNELDQFAVPPLWFRFKPTLAHYKNAFIERGFGSYFLTSFIVSLSSTFLALMLGTFAAYALARFRLPYKLGSRLSMWILSTRMLPPIVTAIPLFLFMRDLQLLDTKFSLVIVYTAFNLPFVVWMMRGFFLELPKELEEAAMIDGDSRLGALFRVILPLVTPGLAATAVFCLIITWNELLFALILTQTDNAMTLPIGIAGRVTQYEIKWGVMSAAGVVAMLPILIFAMVVQRYLVRGLSLGAVKG